MKNTCRTLNEVHQCANEHDDKESDKNPCDDAPSSAWVHFSKIWPHTGLVGYGCHMGELRLFSIGVDEARDMFSAPPELADHLRAVSVPLYPPAPKKRGLIDRLGPITKRHFVPNPLDPVESDAENLLAGRFVSPERSSASWTLVEHWLAELAWSTYAVTLTQAELETWDFDLARAGVSSVYGIGAMFNEELGFPLRPLVTQRTGYVRHAHMANAVAALTSALEQLSGPSAERTQHFLGWLDDYGTWSASASAAGRPQPDLVAILTW